MQVLRFAGLILQAANPIHDHPMKWAKWSDFWEAADTSRCTNHPGPPMFKLAHGFPIREHDLFLNKRKTHFRYVVSTPGIIFYATGSWPDGQLFSPDCACQPGTFRRWAYFQVEPIDLPDFPFDDIREVVRRHGQYQSDVRKVLDELAVDHVTPAEAKRSVDLVREMQAAGITLNDISHYIQSTRARVDSPERGRFIEVD